MRATYTPHDIATTARKVREIPKFIVTAIGDDYEPNAVNAHRLGADVEALAKKWTRKPPARRKQPT